MWASKKKPLLRRAKVFYLLLSTLISHIRTRSITRHQFRCSFVLVFFTGFLNPGENFLMISYSNKRISVSAVNPINYVLRLRIYPGNALWRSFCLTLSRHSLRFLVCVNNVFLFLTFWRSCDLVNLSRALFCHP
jgi:hypothetical protein